jgi:hypothetical protein
MDGQSLHSYLCMWIWEWLHFTNPVLQLSTTSYGNQSIETSQKGQSYTTTNISVMGDHPLVAVSRTAAKKYFTFFTVVLQQYSIRSSIRRLQCVSGLIIFMSLDILVKPMWFKCFSVSTGPQCQVYRHSRPAYTRLLHYNISQIQ